MHFRPIILIFIFALSFFGVLNLKAADEHWMANYLRSTQNSECQKALMTLGREALPAKTQALLLEGYYAFVNSGRARIENADRKIPIDLRSRYLFGSYNLKVLAYLGAGGEGVAQVVLNHGDGKHFVLKEFYPGRPVYPPSDPAIQIIDKPPGLLLTNFIPGIPLDFVSSSEKLESIGLSPSQAEEVISVSAPATHRINDLKNYIIDIFTGRPIEIDAN